MRCNACWRELEGRAIATTCNHLLCTEDASKILGNDGTCPICDQVLSKSHMKPVNVNPDDEWTNMAMFGVSPQILMKSAFRSVMFYIGQMELENRCRMQAFQAKWQQRYDRKEEECNQKLEHAQTVVQKLMKKIQMLQQENESLSKDKEELQEKYSDKCRQKRKVDEMYDQARSELELAKRSAIQPSNNFYSRNEPDLFSNKASMMDHRESVRKDWPILTPETPGPKEDIWPARQNSSNSGGPFDISLGSPAKQAALPVDAVNRRAGGHPMFGTGGSNPSMTLRNLILSPIKRPQLSRSRPQMFTF